MHTMWLLKWKGRKAAIDTPSTAHSTCICCNRAKLFLKSCRICCICGCIACTDLWGVVYISPGVNKVPSLLCMLPSPHFYL
jgi:hypothetical protein